MGWEKFESWYELDKGDRIRSVRTTEAGSSEGFTYLLMEAPDPFADHQRKSSGGMSLRYKAIQLLTAIVNPPQPTNEFNPRRRIFLSPSTYKVFR